MSGKIYEIDADDCGGELPAEVGIWDINGGGSMDAHSVVNILNGDNPVKLPWMGNLRPCRDSEGKWYAEARAWNGNGL